MKVQREKVEQAHGVQLLRSIGAKVYVSGTHRRRGDYQGTMQSPGIPDVEAFLPDARFSDPSGVNPLPRRLLKWEVKASGGKMSVEQRDYQRLCLDAGVAHVCGDYSRLIQWLIENSYVRAASFTAERQAVLSDKP